MTAYRLTPVGPGGVQKERTEEIEVLSYTDLVEQRDLLRADVAGWEALWRAEVNLRIVTQNRLSRAMRVLASLGRLSPEMAGLVAAARREVYGRLP